jgi:hypothetical protein
MRRIIATVAAAFVALGVPAVITATVTSTSSSAAAVQLAGPGGCCGH